MCMCTYVCMQWSDKPDYVCVYVYMQWSDKPDYRVPLVFSCFASGVFSASASSGLRDCS